MNGTHLAMTLDPPIRPGVYLFSRIPRSMLGSDGRVIDERFTKRIDARFIHPTVVFLVDVQVRSTILSARFITGTKATDWEPLPWIHPAAKDVHDDDILLALWSQDPITASVDTETLDTALVERGMLRKSPRRRIHPPELDSSKAPASRKTKKRN